MWNWTPKDENKPVEGSFSAVTHIGKSIVIKGEASGSENVYLDGELEGSVELVEGNLTVGRAHPRQRASTLHRGSWSSGRKPVWHQAR